jgi:hypothetical protein
MNLVDSSITCGWQGATVPSRSWAPRSWMRSRRILSGPCRRARTAPRALPLPAARPGRVSAAGGGHDAQGAPPIARSIPASRTRRPKASPGFSLPWATCRRNPLDSGRGSYSGPLPEGVTRFQERHGLEPDGVIGPATFRSLNTPLQWRVRQLELAMERLRRLPLVQGERVVVVNVPAFRLFAFDSAGRAALRADQPRRGRQGCQPPEPRPCSRRCATSTSGPLERAPSILVNEILPTLRRRPDYPTATTWRCSTSGPGDGDRVSAAILEGLRAGTLRVRQRPGADNALRGGSSSPHSRRLHPRHPSPRSSSNPGGSEPWLHPGGGFRRPCDLAAAVRWLDRRQHGRGAPPAAAGGGSAHPLRRRLLRRLPLPRTDGLLS